MPCPDCGASLDRSEVAPHSCDPDRLLDYRMFALRHEIAWFDRLVASFLDTPEGRFETWLAARDVRRSAS
jgi:hypothetical protein